MLPICHPGLEDKTHWGVKEKRGNKHSLLGPHLALKVAKTKSTVWQAVLEVPHRLSQEPEVAVGVGLRILGLAQAPKLPEKGHPA